MSSILRWSLRFRLLVVVVAAGLIGFGVVHLRSASVEVLPEFTPPYAEVQTESLGLSAQEVEQLITVPLEADLLNGVEDVDLIRSESVPGLSSIVLVFKPGSDIYRQRQLVEERLTQAHALPHVSKPPTLLQPLSSMSRVLMIGMSSTELSRIEQSVLAHWVVRPQLMGVPGVANVSVWGMRDQQLQVQVDPERLRQQHVTLAQVVRSAGNAQVVSPLTFLEGSTPGTGGFIETPQQRLQVRHLIEKLADAATLGEVPVEDTRGRLRLSDVADIRVDHQPLIGDAIVAGGDGLMLVVEKFPGANTVEVTEGVEAALQKLQPGMTGVRMDTSIFRPATYVGLALDNLGVALLAAGGLLLVVLIACRLRWQAIVVALVSVPLSLLAAALVLQLLGQGFDLLTLAGLAAATVFLVDEAVLATERAVRRLRQEPDENGGTRTHVTTLLEVRRPLGYATLIALLPIVPIVAMQGRPGAFFLPMAVAYVLAVLSAMVVALTVAPALTSLLVWRRGVEVPMPSRSSWLTGRYRRTLVGLSRKTSTPILVAAACACVAAVVLPLLSVSLVPKFQDPDVMVELEGEPGISSPRMTALATDLAQTLRDLPGVAGVGAHVGRAITGDRVTNVSSANIWARIDPDADHEATLRAIEDAVRDRSSVDHVVTTYSTERIRQVGALMSGHNEVRGNKLALLTGSDQPLTVRVYGEDLAVLTSQAERVRDVMTGVDGVVQPRLEQPAMEPTIEIEVDLERAQRFGLTPGHVRRAEATLLQGIQVGSVFEQQKVFDVIVKGTPATRNSVQDVRDLLIDVPGGGHVRLGDVADVRVVPTPSVIERDAVSRRVDIEAGVSGRSVAAVAADIGRRLEAMAFPYEYHVEVLTPSTAEEVGWARMLGGALAALITAFLLLQAAFGSWKVAGLAFITLPLALVGGLLTSLLGGAELSLGSVLGFLAVFGLAARTCLVLLAHIRSHEATDPTGDRTEAVQRAAQDRVPAALTSHAAVVALALPFAVLGPRAGLEIAHPMALVVLGGTVSSALVTLLLLPALYLRLAPKATGPADAELDLETAAMSTPERSGARLAGVGSGDAGGWPIGAQVRQQEGLS